MRPVLDGLELPQVQEAAVSEARALAEHAVAEGDGGIVQELGRRAARLRLRGVASGEGAAELLERLEAKHRAGRPLPFTADAAAATRVEQVRIAALDVREEAGKPGRWAYALELAEHREPPPPATDPAADLAVLEEARASVFDLAAALDLAPLFVTGLEPFVGTMQGFLGRLSAFRAAARS